MIKKATVVFIAFLFLISQNSPLVMSQQASSEVFQPGTEISLTAEEKQYLEGVFKDTWNYLATFVDPATGIPYDSDKKQPATSLSNVGLYISATAIAAETGLIGKDEALTRINMALTSLDKVPDWLGFPRVWMSARGLKPIQGTEMFSYSKHVSNLIGGLEIARAVFPNELGETVEHWFQGMDFSGMYDAKTGWIKGGYDVPHKNYATSQPFGPWYYKFLASEARLISFYLVAKGFAPESSWKALDRTIQKDGDKWFFVSSYEDGGAYMPYMASLYIDERNTEMGFSQKNFSLSQIERAQKINAPVWGLSASLDTKGEYIPYGQLKDEIVAPYASMLAMLHFPKEGFQNLKKLDELGARPNQIYLDRRTNFTAFTQEGAVAKPWAILESGEVFFLNKNGAIEKLSAYVDWSKRFNEVKNYDHETMQKILEKIGKKFIAHETTETFIKQIFGPSEFKPGLSEALGDNKKMNELLGLASAAGLYFPGWIQFTDGQKAQIAFSETEGVFKPRAISFNQDIWMLTASGEIQSLKPEIKTVSATEKITTIDKQTLALFAPALEITSIKQMETLKPTGAPGTTAAGMLGENDAVRKTDAKTTLPTLETSETHIALGATKTPGAPAVAEHVLPAYSFKEGFAEKLSTENDKVAADLLVMAIADGQMLPAQIKLNIEVPGNLGFRDAFDWKNNRVEKHYLTPSQGMGFLSLANVLHNHVVFNAFAKDPDVAKALAMITPSTVELAKLDSDAKSCSAAVRVNPEVFAVS